MLIIDTSISMALKDYQLDGKAVDRMTMTQALLDRFTRRYNGKRIGIVVLGDKPHILLQPSEDHDLVRHLIHRLRSTVAGRQAALGDAVAVAAEHVQANDTTSDTVMVLISDAVLPSGKLSPVEGASRAAESGAVLHTIAIGATSMQENDQHFLIYEPTDTKLLRQMAQITGGNSFHAVDVMAMDAALTSIEKHQQASATTRLAPQLQEALYIWPLGLAILLLAISSLLPYLNTSNSAP
jgi:Ca-activated chloride channel family protein